MDRNGRFLTFEEEEGIEFELDSMELDDSILESDSLELDDSRQESDRDKSSSDKEDLMDATNEGSCEDSDVEPAENRTQFGNDFLNVDKKNPFQLLETLLKGLSLEYRQIRTVIDNSVHYRCDVFVSGEKKGTGMFRNKKVAKYLAAIDALNNHGINYDWLKNDDEATEDLASPSVASKSVKFDQTVSLVEYDDEFKCTNIIMKPLTTGDEDIDVSEALSISGSDLDNLSDQPAHHRNLRNLQNRIRNLAFLWENFNPKRKIKTDRPLGSDMIKNPIGFLYERCLKNCVPLPVYNIMCIADGGIKYHLAKISICDYNFSAYGRTKKDARFNAARKLIMYAVKLRKRYLRKNNRRQFQ